MPGGEVRANATATAMVAIMTASSAPARRWNAADVRVREYELCRSRGGPDGSPPGGDPADPPDRAQGGFRQQHHRCHQATDRRGRGDIGGEPTRG
jgi:hypothetical protein